ncbi:MAG: hypothetical protein IPK82_37390 [Polyangiaceae bacterium]|nr:hypothetical protein [Polyangiaceae bacterium]
MTVLPRRVTLRTQFFFRAALGLSLLGSLFCTAQVSLADDPSEKEKEAQKLFLEGRDALARGENEIACVKFRGSLALFPVANTRANVAQCDEKEGNWIAALNTWKALLPELPEGDPRRTAALGRIEALEAKIPKLTLTTPPDFPRDAKVTVDGVVVESSKWTNAILLAAGEHSVVVDVPGRKEQRFAVTLSEGEKKNLPIHPAPAAVPTVTVSATAPPPPPPPAGMSTQRIVGLAVGGLGIAALIGAGITGGMIVGQDGDIQKQCQPGAEPGSKLCTPLGMSLIRDGEPLRLANGVLFGVGLAGLGAGVVLYLTGGSAPKAALTPIVHPHGGGATLTGRF